MFQFTRATWLMMILFALPAVASIQVLGEEPTEERVTSERLDGKQSQTLKVASEAELSLADNASAEVRLLHRSVLSFTNPVRGRDQIGDVYIWVCDREPIAIGSYWTIADRRDANVRRLSIEMTALHSESVLGNFSSLTETRRAIPEWRPSKQDALGTLGSVVGASNVARLRASARQYAKRFVAQIDDPDKPSPIPLRLLPKPIYEYESDKTMYGGLFAFVLATDPELVLHLTASQLDGQTVWKYRAGRMTGKPLSLELDDQAVWSVPKAALWNGNQNYLFCFSALQFSVEGEN